MTAVEIERATVAELAPVIKSRKLPVADVTERFPERIERYNPRSMPSRRSRQRLR